MIEDVRVSNIGDPADCDRADVRICYDYWLSKRAGRFAPAWRDLHLVDLPAELISFLSVVDVLENGEVFRYRFFGTGHGRYHWADYTGKTTDDIEPPEIGRMVHWEYTEVVHRRVPLLFEKYFSEAAAAALSLRMPLSSDGLAVDGILSYSGRGGMLDEMRRVFGTVDAVPLHHR